ncbi:MAG: hypothetical protein IKS48_00435 [Eubacterium sp.]|nr:hypothetical protein [Eubacterium sp.]
MTITGTIPSAIANFLKTEDESLNGIEIKGNDIDVILTDNGTYTELYGVGMGNGSYEIIEIDDNLNLLPEYEKGDVVSNDVLKKMFTTVINSSLILSFNPLGKIKYGIVDTGKAVARGVKKGVNKVKEAGKWVADIISPEDAQNWIRKQKGFERAKVGKVDRIGGLTGGYYAVLAGNPADKQFSVWKLYRNGNEYRTLKTDFFPNSQEALAAYNKLTKADVKDSNQEESEQTNNEAEEVNQTEEKNTLELGEDGWQYTDDGVAYKISQSVDTESSEIQKKEKKKSKYNGCNVSGCVEADGSVALASFIRQSFDSEITLNGYDFDYNVEFHSDGGYVDFWKNNEMIIRVYVDDFDVDTEYDDAPSSFNPNTGNIGYSSYSYDVVSDVYVHTEYTDSEDNIYTEEQFLENNPEINDLNLIVEQAEKYVKNSFKDWWENQ